MTNEKHTATDLETLPYHCFKREEGKLFLEGRYWNEQGCGIAIVAVVTHHNGRGDWAAYIGVTRPHESERTTCLSAAQDGCKLSDRDAKHYFPEITLPYRH